MIKTRKSADAHRTELDPHHLARLHEIPLKQDRTHYACQVLHQFDPAGVSTAAVMAWLAAYGYGENAPHGQKRNRVSPVVAAYRRQHNLDAPGNGMPTTTSAAIFPPGPTPHGRRVAGVVVPFPSVEGSAMHATGRPSAAQASPHVVASGPRADTVPGRPATGPDASDAWPDTTATEAMASEDVADRQPDWQVSMPRMRPAPYRRDLRTPPLRRDDEN